MNRICLFIVSGFLALMLTACGEKDKVTTQPDAGKTTNQVEKTQEKLNKAAKKADENTKKGVETGEGTETKNSTTTNPEQ